MFLLKKFLFFSVFISLFIPFASFGVCEYLFSELYTELKLSKRVVRSLYNADIRTIENLTSKAE